jgi:hypothetical protein
VNLDNYVPSILSPAHTCEECGATCEACVTYDPNLCERVTAWWCPSCDRKFYREEEDTGEVGLLGVARRLRR